jgi:hypothetical protein
MHSMGHFTSKALAMLEGFDVGIVIDPPQPPTVGAPDMLRRLAEFPVTLAGVLRAVYTLPSGRKSAT